MGNQPSRGPPFMITLLDHSGSSCRLSRAPRATTSRTCSCRWSSGSARPETWLSVVRFCCCRRLAEEKPPSHRCWVVVSFMARFGTSGRGWRAILRCRQPNKKQALVIVEMRLASRCSFDRDLFDGRERPGALNLQIQTPRSRTQARTVQVITVVRTLVSCGY